MKSKDRSTYGNIPLRYINVFAQPRKTFEDIEGLAESISDLGLLHPANIAVLTKEELSKYLSRLNELWVELEANYKEYKTEDAIVFDNQNKECLYYVLLSGERRFRACCLLRDTGRVNSLNKHFGGKNIKAEVRYGLDFTKAMQIQFSENIHSPVPKGEEAIAYALYYNFLKKTDNSWNKTRFAKHVGRSYETVNNALKFYDLPVEIQQMAKQKKIHYGIAVEVSRLQEAGYPKEDLLLWTTFAVAKRSSVPEFRESLTNYLARTDEPTLDIFGPIQPKKVLKKMSLKAIERNLTIAVHMDRSYFSRVKQLEENGKLGTVYSVRSLKKLFLKHTEGLIDLVALLGDKLSKRKKKAIIQNIRNFENALT